MLKAFITYKLVGGYSLSITGPINQSSYHWAASTNDRVNQPDPYLGFPMEPWLGIAIASGQLLPP